MSRWDAGCDDGAHVDAGSSDRVEARTRGNTASGLSLSHSHALFHGIVRSRGRQRKDEPSRGSEEVGVAARDDDDDDDARRGVDGGADDERTRQGV